METTPETAVTLTPAQERKIGHIKCNTCRAAMLQRKMPTCHSPSYRGLAIWKPLPADYKNADCHFLYGFPLRKDRVEKVRRRLGLPTLHDWELGASRLGYKLEQITRLMYPICFYRVRADEQSVREGMADPEPEDSERGAGGAGAVSARVRTVPILVIGCTKSRKYYHRRPTPEQMKTLERYLGEARWFRSRESKAEFSTWFIDETPPACS
ncbi:hypothetical protein CC2G_011215 [Coprinopsis cinerea AmutBmut pab1-1]|nr:hypothetical protein CC2G_011215 [Coprinopsis cinerea AmutBmut pab1-1]